MPEGGKVGRRQRRSGLVEEEDKREAVPNEGARPVATGTVDDTQRVVYRQRGGILVLKAASRERADG